MYDNIYNHNFNDPSMILHELDKIIEEREKEYNKDEKEQDKEKQLKLLEKQLWVGLGLCSGNVKLYK